MPSYPLARYRFECVVERPIQQPDYAGSMLRGAFGHALRAMVCVADTPECRHCTLYRSCPYPLVFAPPSPPLVTGQQFSQIPPPYVIEPPHWGAQRLTVGTTFSFHMVLMGEALQQLSLIIRTWEQALARHIGGGKARLHAVCWARPEGEETVWTAGLLTPHTAQIVLPDVAADTPPVDVTLTFTTPLRLQEQGHALPPERLTDSRLLLAIAKRCSLLVDFHMGQSLGLDFAALKADSLRYAGQRDVVWHDWTRYSSRQHSTMTLGGVMGTWHLPQLAPVWLPLLTLGQWLHVGKNTVFGLGTYHLNVDRATTLPR